MEEKETSEKEKRIRAITHLYYSKPDVQKALVDFSRNREVVPRYYEGFGKRPDAVQYASDVLGLVKRGATSFHASEELWNDPLAINSEMTPEELNLQRKGWDLLIDIDSPFLDCSKIAAELLISALKAHGIQNYGLKFSGSKGFHIIVPSAAFPVEFRDIKTKDMFPEWPRAISEYLMDYIRRDYNEAAADVLKNVSAITRRTNLSAQELKEVRCLQCSKPAVKGTITQLHCPICRMDIQRKDMKITNRRLKCLNNDCAGVLEIGDSREYWYCEYCLDPKNDKLPLSSEKYPELFEKGGAVSAEKVAALDLVLVAPRHLFRMPYSLHEKTALASVVLTKEQIADFDIKDADPLRIKVLPYLPLKVTVEEARSLLSEAIDWKRERQAKTEEIEQQKFMRTTVLKEGKKKEYGEVDLSSATEKMFPSPIQKLLRGLSDGRKRGLFVLITFLRSLNYPNEKIIVMINDWNKKNSPPLKEGYVRAQLEWNFRQKKKILPPNYDNPAYYKDLNLLEKKPETKNPVADVRRNFFSRKFAK